MLIKLYANSARVGVAR